MLAHNAIPTLPTLQACLRPVPENNELFEAAIKELKSLHILVLPTPESESETVNAVTLNGIQKSLPSECVVLNKEFANSLRLALVNESEEPWKQVTVTGATDITPDGVEKVAGIRWSSILHFLLDSQYTVPTENVIELLVSTGLMRPGRAPEGVVGSRELSVLGRVMSGDAVEEEEPKGRKVLNYKEVHEEGNGEIHVTRWGYEFLLKDTSVQLWTFMHEYIRTAPSRGLKPTHVLSLLFRLGFSRPGKAYPLKGLNVDEVKLIRDFSSFGLVCLPKGTGKGNSSPDRFYPTSLALLLTQPPEEESPTLQQARKRSKAGSSMPEGGAAAVAGPAALTTSSSAFSVNALTRAVGSSNMSSALGLVVETNFRLYAYSSSKLHIALLALFSRVELLLPNLTVATLTRRTIVSANACGIPCSRIVAFLESHSAVPGRGVPENVHQQLLLWEMEKERVQARKAVLLGPMDSREQTAIVAAVAASHGALLWDGGISGGWKENARGDISRKIAVVDTAVKAIRDSLEAQGILIGLTKKEEMEEEGLEPYD